MAVEDDHLRKPDLEQIEEFSRFTEIQSEIIANLKPSLSTSWTEFLQTSMLLPEPVIGPEVCETLCLISPVIQRHIEGEFRPLPV